jgi:hypothetical protein
MKTRNTLTLLVPILAGCLALSAAHAQGQMIGINVLLNQPATNSVLQDLGAHGQVLDVLPQINGVTLRAQTSELSTIQSLPYVAGASRDEQSDLLSGANDWNLDAVNVTDFGTTPPRVVGYDGAGVYIAVIDSGLPFNWRAYFPEERIAVDLARGFAGGGGDHATVSSQPETWERDTLGHGAAVTKCHSRISLQSVGSPAAFDVRRSGAGSDGHPGESVHRTARRMVVGSRPRYHLCDGSEGQWGDWGCSARYQHELWRVPLWRRRFAARSY